MTEVLGAYVVGGFLWYTGTICKRCWMQRSFKVEAFGFLWNTVLWPFALWTMIIFYLVRDPS